MMLAEGRQQDDLSTADPFRQAVALSHLQQEPGVPTLMSRDWVSTMGCSSSRRSATNCPGYPPSSGSGLEIGYYEWRSKPGSATFKRREAVAASADGVAAALVGYLLAWPGIVGAGGGPVLSRRARRLRGLRRPRRQRDRPLRLSPAWATRVKPTCASSAWTRSSTCHSTSYGRGRWHRPSAPPSPPRSRPATAAATGTLRYAGLALDGMGLLWNVIRSRRYGPMALGGMTAAAPARIPGVRPLAVSQAHS
jgi:hypothetical protein